MAAVVGTEGLVLYKGVPVFRINQWSLNANVDIRDHTSFTTGDLTWRTKAPGLAEWDGSFAGFWDAAGSTAQKDAVDAVLAGSTGTVLLHADKVGGMGWSGSIYFSGIATQSQVDGDATATYSFTGTDTLSYSTTT